MPPPCPTTHPLTLHFFLFEWHRFGKSTALYSSWMILLIVIGEFTTGKVTDGLWSANNSGRTFSTMDWSKFDQFDEDDDDDDDDEDDDDE